MDGDALPLVIDTYAAPQRSMRIACVSETYPPEINGVATTLAELVDGLHRRNHELQLIRPRQPQRGAAEPEPRFHEVLMRGLPIPKYPELRMGMPAKRELIKLWSVRRPDIVHIATEGPLGWSALQAARHLKLPVSSDFRTNFHAYSRHYGVGWLHKPIMLYLRKFHNLAHCTTVPTEALRRDLLGYGFRNLAVVARGVDTVRFDPARRSAALRAAWQAGSDELVIACVGRLAREKNLGVAVRAYEAIAAQRPARLLFVGDGPMRDELRALCPRAIFAGQRTGADLAAHYASADLLLFPSLTESFGNVTTEAMASGLPVVAYDYAAAAQLIRSSINGYTVARDDAAGYVGCAAQAALDLAALRTVGARARVTAREHGWDRVVARFEALLQTVMEPPTPARAGALLAAQRGA